MPFVNIAILAGKSTQYAKAVANGVNEAAIGALDFPEDDRYQLITEYAEHALQLQTRTGDRVMLSLVMRAGKTDAQKKAFYRQVVDKLSVDPGIEPHNMMITIVENRDIDWSFADGQASFIER
ncbi:tautomerase-like protein [Kushneria sinocarnis]|uniref:Tautomerase-like protein n=1 Tax=Kushneria sinocarnis TaxID=595502 RepID=A0A420WW81_9GAMM|nr:tautomerase family protein [Kushneria sinocarnis]RKR03371.1 tautomerase-like protein [Kushneria sinocarnis]